MNEAILLAVELAPNSIARLREHYTVHQATTEDARHAVAQQFGAEIQAIVSNGTTGASADLIGRLPHLSLICAMGVGFENIDLAAARSRGITVTNGPGINAESVADHAFGLMLALIRNIVASDALVRSGGWREASTSRPRAHLKRLGILGMGDIGGRIARRAAGFEMQVSYHNRNPVAGSPYRYEPSPLALADNSDILMVVLPGGAGTRHIVGKAEIEALGPAGFLVNVGRGSVVDTASLIDALQTGRLAGAALDVIEGEPNVPKDLSALPNVILTPHMAGRSPESASAAIDLVIRNLTAHFAEQPVLTPVP